MTPPDGSPEPQATPVTVLRTASLTDSGTLRSISPVAAAYEWSPDVNTARCVLGRNHRAPQETCSCGFYGYSTLRWALHDDTERRYPTVRHVLCVTEFTGRILIGERGARGEHARITAIYLSPSIPAPLAALVEERYPHATVYRNRATMLREHPLSGRGEDTRTPWRSRIQPPVIGAVVALLLIGVYLGLREFRASGNAADTAFLIASFTGVLLTAALARGWLLLPVAVTLIEITLRPTPTVQLVALVLAAVAIVAALIVRWRLRMRFRPEPVEETLGRVRAVRKDWSHASVHSLVQLGVWAVQITTYEGDIVFVMPTRGAETDPATLAPLLRQHRVVAVILSDTDVGTLLLTRHGKRTRTVAVSLRRLQEALSLPERVWVPRALREACVTAAVEGRDVPPAIPATITLPPLDDQVAATALKHAVAVALTARYRVTQAEIAHSGMTPAVTPALPARPDPVHPAVLVDGWRRIMLMPARGGEAIADLYEEVRDDLPVAARLTHGRQVGRVQRTQELLGHRCGVGWSRVPLPESAATEFAVGDEVFVVRGVPEGAPAREYLFTYAQ